MLTNYFFWEFSSTIAASSKKDRYLPLRVHENTVDVSKILPCESRVQIVVILEGLNTINCGHIRDSFKVEMKKYDTLTVAEAADTLLLEAATAFSGDTLQSDVSTAVLDKTLSRLLPNKGVETPEVSVTASFVDQLIASGQWTDFEVGHQTRHQISVTRYSNSTSDLEIYHRDKFVSNATVRGAVFSSQPEVEEPEDEKLHIKEGSEKENGIGQLRCYMIKMAGTLALAAVKTGRVSFTKIIIYGLLINHNDTKHTSVGRLTMDFKKQESHIDWCNASLELKTCLERIHYILSGDNTQL